jgi:hypothetical protein
VIRRVRALHQCYCGTWQSLAGEPKWIWLKKRPFAVAVVPEKEIDYENKLQVSFQFNILASTFHKVKRTYCL